MGDGEGVPEASGVEKNLGGGRQGVVGRVKSPRGTNTPRVEDLPRGEEISRVTPEGDGVKE